MSIPMSFVEDIVGIKCLVLRSVFKELVFVKEKWDLFTKFPIGATIQDSGKRKEVMLINPFIIICSIFQSNKY